MSQSARGNFDSHCKTNLLFFGNETFNLMTLVLNVN